MIDSEPVPHLAATTHVTKPVYEVVTAGLASLYEMKTKYGCRDLYTLREMLYVQRYNDMIINSHE